MPAKSTGQVRRIMAAACLHPRKDGRSEGSTSSTHSRGQHPLATISPPCSAASSPSIHLRNRRGRAQLHRLLSSAKLNPRRKSKLKSTMKHCPSILLSGLSTTVVTVLIAEIKLRIRRRKAQTTS
ncbi:hypothetical protein DY000_02042423 [Brassica cretica]|uniref:Uncharacterized protein n=1 Tax=Brassica cretica TaxID=69181 RepID=A0ABQ7BBZ8_BRACR|nr:hypothetical protein DY000_02042423 [Brassica cretica]